MRIDSSRRLRIAAAAAAGLGALALARSADAAALGTILVTPSFETAGIIVELTGDDGNETVSVEVKGPGDADFHAAHPTTLFEPHAFATSLFELAGDTDYSVRVTLADPDGVSGSAMKTVTLHTRAEPKLPAPKRVRWVGPSGQDAAGAGASKSAPYATPGYALAHAQPGDEIRVLAGTYGAVSADGVHGTDANPIVLRADDPNQKPLVDGGMAGTALQLNDTSYVVIDGFEVTNGGDDAGGNGVYLRASAHDVVRNCFIHDNGHNDLIIAKADEYSGGAVASGFHLVEHNDIADLTHDSCGGASNTACANQTYYGIKLDNNAGAGTVIRNNRVRGHVDNSSPCGDEDSGRDLADGAPVLAVVGNGGPWTNHDLELYDNRFEDAKDDGMELDGICVNARIYRNVVDNAQNAFSAAPVMPGPYFFVRNVATGNWGPSDSGFKMNTAGNSSVPSRHVFVYHNTFVRSNQGTLVNLWFAVEGDHNVPIHDFVFKNNVFWATAGGECTDAYNHGTEQPSFDGDVWFTSDTTKVFSWWNGATTDHYDTFAAFQSGTSQEANGAFGDPGLDADFVPKKGALVVDRAIPIPGINDHFVGKAPDVGAYELGGAPPPGTGGGGGSAGPGAGGGSGAGGPGSGGGGAGGAGGDGNGGGCGCEAAGTPAHLSGGAALLLALAMLARRRRQPRRASGPTFAFVARR